MTGFGTRADRATIHAILMKEGALDWRTGAAATVANYFDEAVDIHHIFPKAWCEERAIDPRVFNSIINKTPLTARTNRSVGGRAPSEHLPRLANASGLAAGVLDTHLASHLCDPSLMHHDDFEAFYAARRRALLDRIGVAYGKGRRYRVRGGRGHIRSRGRHGRRLSHAQRRETL
jgi:hypothetical protein